MDRDLACGLIGFAVALVYLTAAAAIPESGLGDTVGASGVPIVLGYALAAVSALFCAQRLLVLHSGAGEAEPAESGGVFDTPLSAFTSAAGTVAICTAFILLFETAGYLLSVGLLIFAMCLYQGVRPGLRLVAISAGGALVLWILFAVLLSVRMPQGIWAELV